jgi:hypothetical protein
MKTLSGHLTESNKKAIKAILDLNLSAGKVGRINYFITPGPDHYQVKIVKMDRGMIPVPGSQLRQSISLATFSL